MSNRPAIYRKVSVVTKDGFRADIRLACVSIDFFQDIMSPALTAKIVIANTMTNIEDDQGATVSLYEGLKLRGGEAVEIEIEANSEENLPIEFKNPALYVSGVSEMSRKSLKQFFTINLYTKEAYDNETKFLEKAYPKESRVSDHVNTIVSESFPTSTLNKVDTTSNTYGFLGNQLKPFYALIRLASKAVPEGAGSGGNSATAGFFFYQSMSGFNFRSIDKMMGESPKAQYTYTEVSSSEETGDFEATPELPSNRFKIEKFHVTKNQNLLKNLSQGVYSSAKKFFNPVDFTVTPPQEFFSGDQYIKGVSNLGQAFNPQDISLAGESLSFTNVPTRILSEVYDIGTVEKEVNQEPTQNPDEFLAQRKMRYNTLFTQDVYIQVSVNTNLEAGDIIKCLFPKTQECPSDDVDQDQLSGLYMIKEIRHHFDTRGSYSSMRLLRDTFGLYGANNK